jgi:hypothetical protein
MWNVNERFEKNAIDSLAALGFGAGSTRAGVRVEKYGSGAEFRQEPDGRFRMTVLLWDAGYQKFLLTLSDPECSSGQNDHPSRSRWLGFRGKHGICS